jgi:hypothetical protein
MAASRQPSWVRQLGRVAALTLSVLAALAGSTLLIALPLAWATSADVIEPGHLLAGTVCGLAVWLSLTYFHLKRQTLSVPFHDRDAFASRLTSQLQDLGYEVCRPRPDQLVSRPTFWSLLLGGGLQVRLLAEAAQITGPKLFVTILKRRLRVAAHLDRVHQAFQAARQRLNERLLKRVQISLRFAPDQWTAVAAQVVDLLRLSGADVLCDLHLLVGNDTGVPEGLIDGPIRDWLQKHALQYELHKDLPQWEEPGWRHTLAGGHGDTPICRPSDFESS